MADRGRFAGRVAIVTGAGSGIGGEAAKLLAEEGAAVMVVDVDERNAHAVANEISATGGSAIASVCDVRNTDEVVLSVESAVAAFGSVHVLVNNAGIMREARIEDMEEQDFLNVLDVNLTSAFRFSKAVQPLMCEQRYGKIVMTSSRAALGAPGYSSYASSKAGMQGLASALAWELGPFGVNVNCVAPGHVTTPLTEALAIARGGTYGDLREEATSRIALPDVASPRDIAEVIAFLSSDAARFITGQSILTTGRPMQ